MVLHHFSDERLLKLGQMLKDFKIVCFCETWRVAAPAPPGCPAVALLRDGHSARLARQYRRGLSTGRTPASAWIRKLARSGIRGLAWFVASSGMQRMITIAGGGLAGLSLGIALQKRGVPVTLHEAGSYPRHRVCGEFISGVSPETLDSLGIGHVFEDAERHRSTAWFFRGRKIFSDQLPSGLGISRFTLDKDLRGNSPSLAEICANTRAKNLDGRPVSSGVEGGFRQKAIG